MASDAPLSEQAPGARRTPKVGVYVPRHRRGNDDPSSPGEPADPNQASATSTSRQQNTGKALKKTGASNESPAEDVVVRPGSSSSNGEVQRRGRGKFMGPGVNNGSTSVNSGEGSGTSRSHRDHRSTNNRSTSNSGSSSTSSPSQQSLATTTATVPRPPRGRDFDATVLRRYSDDENKPNSSFSRSGSFSSGRSHNNNNGGSSSYSPNTRSSGRSQDSSSTRKPDRAEEGPWRREEPKRTGDQEPEQETTIHPDDEAVGSTLSNRLEQIQLGEEGHKDDESESSEELEEWELALQDSDEDGIPSIENTKTSKLAKSHPAEHLRNSTTSKSSKDVSSTEGMCNR